MDLMTTRLMQIKKRNIRRVALVEEPTLRFLDSCSSVYELAHIAIGTDTKLSEVARQRAQPETVDYDPIDAGRSEWRLLPTMDHPDDSARCVLAGTGLTHLGSARGRQSMHANTDSELTDSMKMFHWGVEGGRPAPGCIGTPPACFYKGTGGALRAHGETLDIPACAEDGGEEAEIAGVYVVARMAALIAWAWRPEMNSRIIRSKKRTTSTWRAPSSAPVRSDQNWWLIRNLTPSP